VTRSCFVSLRWAFLFGLAITGCAAPAVAHPHAWISVRTTIMLDSTDRVIAIREHWLFDKAYSAYALADFSPHKKDVFTEADLLPLAKENIANLKEYGYFTVFEDMRGASVKLGEAEDIAGSYEQSPPNEREKVVLYATPQRMKKKFDMASVKQISMDFTIPLAVPVDLRGRNVAYRIYDPTYYVDMTHYERNPVSFVRAHDGAVVSTCQASVILPKTDQAMIFSAAALDKNATAPKDLGYYFSEKVSLSCSPPQ